jgi:hypothetical protein
MVRVAVVPVLGEGERYYRRREFPGLSPYWCRLSHKKNESEEEPHFLARVPEQLEAA